jgi:hypothetical protein
MVKEEATDRRVLLRLQAGGVVSAKELASAAGVSQPSVSRALTRLGSRVVRIGRARATRYALARSIGQQGARWPIYQIGEDSSVSAFGTLHSLMDDGWWVDISGPRPDWLEGEFRDGLFPGLPWFLDDLRPQGFMGRAFARRHAADLGMNEDPTLWSSEQVLLALLLRGEDLLGNFVLGEAALERAQRQMLQPPDAIPEDERAGRYGALAAAALAGDVVGSSAGGEQPKFTAVVAAADSKIRRVIVKFSESMDTPSGRRWADLLISEHLAAQQLARSGVPAAASEIVFSDGRCCLEVARFDRVGTHGRVGFVSLQPLDAAHYGQRGRWIDAAARLERDRWLGSEDADRLRVLWWFGGLIANTDMHFANTGFFLRSRPLSLVPSFDMLPMLYRPHATGEIVVREFHPPLPPPDAVGPWRRAATIAEDYWRLVEQTSDISTGFREIAGRNAETLRAARARFGAN